MNDWSTTLEDDLNWREKELASLKRLTILNTENELVHRAMLRASWALLYAHFEGFTKFCWEFLLDQVQVRRIAIEELREDFLLLALEKRFRQLKSQKAEALWAFFREELPTTLSEVAVFPENCLVAEDNLWPNVFERECARIGIFSSALDSSRSHIKALVSRRNDIAHGKRMIIKSIEEYSEYENVVVLVMHDLAVQVLDLLEKEAYKKQDTNVLASHS